VGLKTWSGTEGVGACWCAGVGCDESIVDGYRCVPESNGG
jgi:hypothetical protein